MNRHETHPDHSCLSAADSSTSNQDSLQGRSEDQAEGGRRTAGEACCEDSGEDGASRLASSTEFVPFRSMAGKECRKGGTGKAGLKGTRVEEGGTRHRRKVELDCKQAPAEEHLERTVCLSPGPRPQVIERVAGLR